MDAGPPARGILVPKCQPDTIPTFPGFKKGFSFGAAAGFGLLLANKLSFVLSPLLSIGDRLERPRHPQLFLPSL